MTRTAKVPCPGKNCKKRCEARCEICGVPLGWTELIDFRKELGRNSEDLLILGCSGVPATCVQEESARNSRWELRGSDLKSSNFPSQQIVSLAILFMFLPLPKFKLLNLLRFHLYTCKTTLFLVFAVVQWVVLFLCVTMDSPLMVFLTFLPMYNLQSHTAWHASRGKCRKGAEQQQPGCKLQLDSLPVGWNHTSPQVVASFAARNMDKSHPTLGRKWPKKV